MIIRNNGKIYRKLRKSFRIKYENCKGVWTFSTFSKNVNIKNFRKNVNIGVRESVVSVGV